MPSSSAQSRPVSRLRRWTKRLLWSAGASFLLLLTALHALDWHFRRLARDLEKLARPIDVATRDGKIRCYTRTATNASLDIIFVHGTPAQAGIWHAQFENPFPNASLTAIDRPGFGGSKPALKTPTLKQQAMALESLLNNTTAHRTILVGHSYGGPLVLLAALKYPEKVSAVVLVGSSVDPSQEKPFMAQRIADWPVFAWLLPRTLRQCNRELLTLRGDLVELQKLLPALRVPIVMLHGGRDRQVPVENVAWLERQLSAAGRAHLFTALVHPGYSHFIPWEHPEDVTEAIDAALKK